MRKLFSIIILIQLITFSFSSCKGRKNKNKDGDVKVETVKNEYQPFIDKYATQIGVESNQLVNGYLYMFIDDWIGVPYKWAGNDKTGTDCSGFVGQVYKNVYKKDLARSAKDMIDQCESVSKDKLQEGDLVFFDISSKNSHVGIYLTNQKFIHASSSKGVMISTLTENYWTKYWGRAGRVK